MKIAFYPGSFNPWHEGHEDVVEKALKIFDKIIILQMSNADKKSDKPTPIAHRLCASLLKELDMGHGGKLDILERPNMGIRTAIGHEVLAEPNHDYAIIRGLRNEQDFCKEQIQQYWYEDLAIKCPILYIIADRRLVHISSSAIRAVNKFTE